MSTRYTANQGAPFPDINEPLNNMNDWIYNLGVFLETRGVQRFTNQADLSTKRPSPTGGEFAWVTADVSLYVYDGSAWKRVFPPAPMVYSGTATPAGTLGQVGDLYIKTT